MNVRVDLYIHSDLGGDATLRRIEERLNTLVAQGKTMGAELDDLTNRVSDMRSVEQGAVTLLNGLSQQIASLKTDPAALQQLADDLASQSTELAAAVAANTPAAPAPPAP